MMEAYFPELMASLTGTVLTEILLYPLETVVYRLHLQGTRTMIDDTDNGFAVVSLCTNYDGFLDCFSRIKSEEGLAGFYKGFGALLLQYLVQYLVLRFTKGIYMAISHDFRGDGTNK
jgi:solute carrier family 25 protein 46